jgi:GTP cyclohydrolase I
VNAPERFFMPDIQSSRDHRQLAIQQVGVKGLRYPLTLLDAAGEAHPTVATLAMTVGLPPEVKGTHMSRFVEILERPARRWASPTCAACCRKPCCTCRPMPAASR